MIRPQQFHGSFELERHVSYEREIERFIGSELQTLPKEVKSGGLLEPTVDILYCFPTCGPRTMISPHILLALYILP
jgi:hypothetical protein